MGVGRALDVDRGGNTISAIAGRAPRDGRGAGGGAQVDTRKYGRVGRVITDLLNSISLECLCRPHKLCGSCGSEGRARNTSELRDVVEAAPTRACQGDESIEHSPGGGCDGRGKECLAADEVPACEGPKGAAPCCGGTPLEHGLQDGVAARGLDRVEEEDGLTVVRGRCGWDCPFGGERVDGGAGVEPRCVRDPAGRQRLYRR